MSAHLPIDDATRRLLQEHAFNGAVFEAERRALAQHEAGPETNRLSGEIKPPTAGDIAHLPALGTPSRAELSERGRAALARGEVGVVILAGGMATRFGGVVKAGVTVYEGESFLSLKLADAAGAADRARSRVPVYVMTSFATHEEVNALGLALAQDGCPVTCFRQSASLRLTPEGEIFRDAEGLASPYAPGHGDLPAALRRSGVLTRFLESGGKTLFMSNVDNLLATLDPAVLGYHLEQGRAMTVEVVQKEAGDQGGAPARVDGHLQIVEAFRFPSDFDQERIPVFNTNTLVFDAKALDRDFSLTPFYVEKQVDGRMAVQFETLVGQLSAMVPSSFLLVERFGPDARFAPVKGPDELERRRDAIRRTLAARVEL